MISNSQRFLAQRRHFRIARNRHQGHGWCHYFTCQRNGERPKGKCDNTGWLRFLTCVYFLISQRRLWFAPFETNHKIKCSLNTLLSGPLNFQHRSISSEIGCFWLFVRILWYFLVLLLKLAMELWEIVSEAHKRHGWMTRVAFLKTFQIWLVLRVDTRDGRGAVKRVWLR